MALIFVAAEASKGRYWPSAVSAVAGLIGMAAGHTADSWLSFSEVETCRDCLEREHAAVPIERSFSEYPMPEDLAPSYGRSQTSIHLADPRKHQRRRAGRGLPAHRQPSMRFPYPSREPTPAEYAVLVMFVAVVFILVGVVALVAGIRAPPDKHVRVAQSTLERATAWLEANQREYQVDQNRWKCWRTYSLNFDTEHGGEDGEPWRRMFMSDAATAFSALALLSSD